MRDTGRKGMGVVSITVFHKYHKIIITQFLHMREKKKMYNVKTPEMISKFSLIYIF